MKECGKSVAGTHVQAVFAKRGYEMTIEEARKFDKDFPMLYEFGALVFYDKEGNEITLDDVR